MESLDHSGYLWWDFYVWSRNSEDIVKRARPLLQCQVLLDSEHKPSPGSGPLFGMSMQFPVGRKPLVRGEAQPRRTLRFQDGFECSQDLARTCRPAREPSRRSGASDQGQVSHVIFCRVLEGKAISDAQCQPAIEPLDVDACEDQSCPTHWVE